MEVPVAFFAYKRPEHTERALKALIDNVGFDERLLYVYCDGPRKPNDGDAVEATRQIVRKIVSDKANVVFRDQNKGLAASVIEGVDDLTRKFGCCVVVEDDLVTSPYFLQYMTKSLHAYEANERVMQISGHMFPVGIDSQYDACFLPFITSWGWGTWRRAWESFDRSLAYLETLSCSRKLRRRFDLDGAYPYYRMLELQKLGKVDSWAILWYSSVFQADGLALYPIKSLIQNTGFDGTGTHSGKSHSSHRLEHFLVDKLPPVEVDPQVQRIVYQHLRKEHGFLGKLWKWLNTKFKV